MGPGSGAGADISEDRWCGEVAVAVGFDALSCSGDGRLMSERWARAARCEETMNVGRRWGCNCAWAWVHHQHRQFFMRNPAT